MRPAGDTDTHTHLIYTHIYLCTYTHMH